LLKFLQFWRRDASEADGRGTYPLCRVRHATLHPGASLWTPGTSGGSLGGGAEDALIEAGLGGIVAVGFQTSAREQIHPAGVLARIEATEPFPEGIDPAGLGAMRRFHLIGLTRVTLLAETVAHRRVPTIDIVPAEACPGDLAEPPAALREVLCSLRALEHAWAPHWREAFELLGPEPLGQWATTLGWRLSPEERLALFDDPTRIGPLLLENLEAMHQGLAPERREASPALTLRATRRLTAAPPHRWLSITTDAQGWAVFHPADAGRGPPDSGTFRRPLEAAGLAANRILIPEPAGGPLEVLVSHPARLGELGPARTAGDMVGAQGAAGRVLVRHGRLYLGPTAALARDGLVEQHDGGWVDVPNGLYQVHVGPMTPEQRAALAPEADGRTALLLLVLEPVETQPPTAASERPSG
jgi:hypothetical protein